MSTRLQWNQNDEDFSFVSAAPNRFSVLFILIVEISIQQLL